MAELRTGIAEDGIAGDDAGYGVWTETGVETGMELERQWGQRRGSKSMSRI